jgi:uncharacterized integral membrane protein (TIGR00701 family)
VIKHLDGVCHCYIDSHADIEKAIRVADNAKTQRYSPCNTMETLLVHDSMVEKALMPLVKIYLEKKVELRVCPRTRSALEQLGLATSSLVDATEEDWRTEYLAPILSIRLVKDLDEAIDHIETHGSHHTDTILTEHHGHAMRFIREVDSASVMINASTRFADGFEFGLGAEIGISTNKLHARGPVGLEGLTTQKFVVFGNGIFVTRAMVEAGEAHRAERERLQLMARKLYRFMLPLMIGTLVFGLWLWIGYGIGMGPGNGWMHAKLLIVVLLIGYHHICGSLLKKFEAGQSTRSHVWFRWFNEAPVIMLIASVILVVVKPF